MGSEAATPPARLEQMFAQQAALTPEAPAIVFKGRTIRYADLAEQADVFARDLIRFGVGPGVIVAIGLQRTPAMIAAILATFRAGAAYLPLDARYPAARAEFVLSDSGAGVLLTDGATLSVGDYGGAVLETAGGRLLQRRGRVIPPGAGSSDLPADLAYVIYTSGSTGAPKGVMLGHGATHLVEWARGAYSAGERARVAATTSLCFDPSVFEIFVPLCTGGALILKESALEPFSPDERPTMLDSVPSVLAELCRGGLLPHSLSVLNVGGERLSADLVRAVYEGRPDVTLFNHYGPTEATTCATVARVPRAALKEPSIGRPMRGAEVLLLDGDGRAVEDGGTGEIHIGGPGLALGYLRRPELTAERFLSGPSGRLYRTGDLACWRDGELHFGGRTDQQVKIRGFRVELGEVEAALLNVDHVEHALAVVREAAGGSELVAYVQARQPLAAAAVRNAAAAWLPSYMLPARVVVLNAFPRLPSGKIDRDALPLPAPEAGRPVSDTSRMEWPIVQIFEEVLGRRSIGPEDSFFDLGGDSLASVRAALRLGELLGYELPAALIHQSPTPRALAASLDHARVRSDGHVSLLQPGGAEPPLFCVADLFGQAFNYLGLSRRLAGDRSSYGVVPGPLQGAFTKDGDVARLTRGFVAELRRMRPEGPYLIAGHSSGGLLAQDIACALEQDGQTVALVLLDAYLHSQRPSARALARWSVRQGRSMMSRRAALTTRSRTDSLAGKLLRRLGGGAPPEWIPRPQLAFAARMIRTGMTHQPNIFSGPTLVIKATERDPLDDLSDSDGLLGWSSALKGEVTQRAVQGSHYTFMREPGVEDTAAPVQDFLRAQARRTPSRQIASSEPHPRVVSWR